MNAFDGWGASVSDLVAQNQLMLQYARSHGNVNIEAVPTREARMVLLQMLFAEHSNGVRCWQMGQVARENADVPDDCYCAKALAILLDVSAVEMGENLFHRVMQILSGSSDEMIAAKAGEIAALIESGEAGQPRPYTPGDDYE